MKPLILQKSDASAPCRAVLITAKILGLPLEPKEIVIFRGDTLQPEYLQKNPMHSVPLLEDGDFVLADSHAICTYLISKYGAEKRETLYPGELRLRATIDQRLHFDTGVLFQRQRDIIRNTFINKATGPTEAHIAELEDAYGILERYLRGSSFLAGDRLTVADICAVATVSSLNVLYPVKEDKYPKTVEWLSKLKTEDWFQNANVPGLLQFEGLVKQLWKNNSQGN